MEHTAMLALNEVVEQCRDPPGKADRSASYNNDDDGSDSSHEQLLCFRYSALHLTSFITSNLQHDPMKFTTLFIRSLEFIHPTSTTYHQARMNPRYLEHGP